MTVENISIDVKTNAGSAAKQFRSLSDAMREVNDASKNASGNAGAFSGIESAVKRARKDAEPLSAELQSAIKNADKVAVFANKAATAEEKMYKAFKGGNESAAWREREKYLNADAAMQREIGKQSDEATHPLSAEQQALISTADAAQLLALKLDNLKEAQREAFQSGDWNKAVSTQGQILSTQSQLDRVSEAARKAGESSREATPKVFSLKSAVQSLASAFKKLFSHGNSASKSVRKVGASAKSSTGFMGKLFNSIKRIAFYRLLRTFIKELSQAFQEGLKNAYAFSRGINGSLATALDHLASISGQMKNQMGAAFGELLQTIMPIIEAIVSAITRLMSALSALFAALGGRMQYLSAGDTAEGWDKATGAAKKYKNTILGFDEINRLNDENGGGGGSGADQGVWELADLPDWAKKIKDAIDNGDWYAAGKALADHLNELIEAWDAYAAGKALGEKINNVIAFAFGFLKNFNFGNLGKKVAEFFNGIFDTVNWDMLGRTLVRAITGVFDFLIGFLENINLGSIGKAISDFIIGAFDEATMWLGEHDWGEVAQNLSKNIHNFFQNVDWKGIAASVSQFLSKAFSSLSSFISNVDWKQLGSDFFNAVNDTLNGIDFSSIAKSFFELLGTALVAAVEFIWGFIEQVGLDIADYFDQFIEFDGNESFLEIGAKILGGILEGIAQALVDVYFWIMDNVVHPIIKAFCDAFGINSPSTVMRDEVGEHVGNGLLEGIAAPILTIYNWLKENIVDPIVNNFKSLFGIESGDSTIFSGFGENIIGGLLSGLKNAWESVTQWFSTAWDGLKTWFEGRSLNLKLSGTTVNDGGYSHFSGNFASGGMPETGSLFVAGEAGAELVTNMGNGRTGVTNVEQMREAVREGNYDLLNTLQGGINIIVKAINEIDPDIQLDGQSLADKMYHYNQQAGRRYGVAMVT